MLPRLALPLAAAIVLLAPAAASADELVVPVHTAGTVQIVDTAAGAKAGDPIPVGGLPARAVVSPDGRDAWVTTQDPAGEAPGHLVRVDLATGEATPVQVGVQPAGLAVSPDGSRVYVANFRSQDVSIVDAATLTVLATPGGVGQVDSVAITPDGAKVYVSDSSSNALHVLDPAAKAFTDTPIWLAGPGRRMQVSPDGSRLYVAVQDDGVRVVDIATDSLLPGRIAGQPGSLALTADGARLYAGVVGPSQVSAIDTAAFAPAGAPFPLAVRSWASGLSVSPSGTRVFVYSNGNNIDPGELRTFDAGTAETIGTPIAFPTTADEVEPGLVPDQAPVAAFTAAPAAPGAPTRFDATGSSDPDGTVARYDWDFGDGTSLADGGPHPEHVYATAGGYTATLTVTDAAGTSTARVFTGTTALRNGLPRARTSRAFTVAVPPTAKPPVTTPPASGGPAPDHTAPRLTRLRLAAARVSYRLDEGATVTWTVQRRVRAHHGTRWVRARGGARRSATGRSAFAVRRLAPGRYRLVARARDAAGNRGRTVTVRLRVRG
jgi:YVTN family beta-propeller protein